MAESELTFEEKNRLTEISRICTPLLIEHGDLMLKAYRVAQERGVPIDIQAQLYFAQLQKMVDELRRGGGLPFPMFLTESSMN